LKCEGLKGVWKGCEFKLLSIEMQKMNKEKEKKKSSSNRNSSQRSELSFICAFICFCFCSVPVEPSHPSSCAEQPGAASPEF
jgi:hypothetical protein